MKDYQKMTVSELFAEIDRLHDALEKATHTINELKTAQNFKPTTTEEPPTQVMLTLSERYGLDESFWSDAEPETAPIEEAQLEELTETQRMWYYANLQEAEEAQYYESL
jgi:peptidoglycan/xylan/chitin deacetylase (PgdA/CDA1 family)